MKRIHLFAMIGLILNVLATSLFAQAGQGIFTQCSNGETVLVYPGQSIDEVCFAPLSELGPFIVGSIDFQVYKDANVKHTFGKTFYFNLIVNADGSLLMQARCHAFTIFESKVELSIQSDGKFSVLCPFVKDTIGRTIYNSYAGFIETRTEGSEVIFGRKVFLTNYYGYISDGASTESYSLACRFASTPCYATELPSR